jgi:hypothetical protein
MSPITTIEQWPSTRRSPLSATEVVDEAIPIDVYANWLQECLHEALFGTSSIPDHPACSM